VTRRNIDVGTLVQADTTSGTFMFTLSQSSVLRIQLFVPQDAAIGVKPGIDAVVRVPEVPGRSFPGKVTRIAVALDPLGRLTLTADGRMMSVVCDGRTELPAGVRREYSSY
jgi:multidrug efflux pump subunit AcrA (membrane-fusion protein)